MSLYDTERRLRVARVIQRRARKLALLADCAFGATRFARRKDKEFRMRNSMRGDSTTGRKGRPLRNRIVFIRVSDTERALVRERAASVYMSVSEFVRRAALGKRLQRDQIPPINLHAFGELGRIKNNLQQLERLASMGRVPAALGPLAAQVGVEVEELREVLAGIREP